ncbi:hypothetical protein BC938DRAFT_476015 [Jimgerdemannia flammicorona]|uniref:Uncharacterized protein n=1 Tax=Jimgerdemannia flammicorona TaxID=994334 RepID=A0A433PLI0_9FUNG|nr:hypothetical protein BC938DRAFT_476015 [Jimgerdemannia flammicorona]
MSVHFVANRFKTENEVHDIQDRARVDYASNLHGRPSLPVKHRDSDVSGDREAMKSFNADTSRGFGDQK